MPIPARQRAARTVVGHRVGDVDRVGHDAGTVQRRPEAVGRVAEVGLGGRGPQARVDPDEEQPRAGSEEVGHLGVAERLQLRPGEPHGTQPGTRFRLWGSVAGLTVGHGRRHPPRHPGHRRAQRQRRADAPPAPALAGRSSAGSPTTGSRWLRRHLGRQVEQPAGRPIEEIARSIRRLGGEFHGGHPGRSWVKSEALRRAYDDALAEGCRALDVHYRPARPRPRHRARRRAAAGRAPARRRRPRPPPRRLTAESAHLPADKRSSRRCSAGPEMHRVGAPARRRGRRYADST